MVRIWSGLLAAAIALAFGECTAQPQAPVTWTQSRWFGLAPIPVVTQVVPMGDTLALSGIDGSQSLSYTVYSYDNGQSVSDWQLVSSSQPENNALRLSGSRGNVLLVRIYTGSAPWQSWIRTSFDGGASWSADHHFISGGNRYPFLSGLVGASVRTNVIGGIRCAITTDAGTTWQPEMVVPQADTLYNITLHSLTMTQGSLILLAYRQIPGDRILRYSISADSGVSWTAIQDFPNLPEQAGALNSHSVVADHSSQVALVSTTWYPGFDTPQQLWVHRTTDGGQTWDTGRPLTDSATVRAYDEPVLFCRGKLWGIAWPDIRDGGTPDLLWRFSANHGRDWYPAQTVIAEVRGLWQTVGQFVVDSVRLYRIENLDPDADSLDVRTISGAIEADLLPPEMFAVSLPDDSADIGDTLSFALSVADNDTLSLVHMFVVRDGSDTVVVLCSRTGDFSWQSEWVVGEPGLYRYGFEAEDFWENREFLVDSSEFWFATRGLSTAQQSPAIAHAYAVGVYPNPANVAPVLTLAAGWYAHGNLSIRVINLLGQEVGRLSLTSGHVQSRYVPLDPLFSNATSGIYFLEVHNAVEHATVKILILQ